jgi:hypothetical protein
MGNALGVVFTFTGTVSGIYDTADYVPDTILAGQVISGTINYSTANLSDFDPGNPDNGVYRFIGAALGEFTMTVNLVTPGHAYAFTSVVAPVSQDNYIQVQTPAASSHYLSYVAGDPLLDGGALPATANGATMSLDFSDPTRTALSSDAVLTAAPVLASFENVGWNLNGYTTGGIQVYGISADLTSLTPVPEPGEWAVIAGGLLGVFAVVRRRLGHSAR